VESADFLQLPHTQLIKLVGSDGVNVEREEVVYTAVMKWINENIDSRRFDL
jgi:hypothetical protein